MSTPGQPDQSQPYQPQPYQPRPEQTQQFLQPYPAEADTRAYPAPPAQSPSSLTAVSYPPQPGGYGSPPQPGAYGTPPSAYGTPPPAGPYAAMAHHAQYDQGYYAPTGERISAKSRTVASLLSFFLGGLGIDRFYLGNIGMGVAKLFLGWLTLGIWPLIDFIVIVAGSAHDGTGARVSRWE